ncbi:MAG TPA: hypothetical protein VFY73_08070 [Ideonella sp.]|uniref:hypothetical protein n=1 Tax=Ideonella sp. TaxID=1929293 RepID=UPI002E3351DF|nr:hypothetical protein [Ideonella sp.]HEX5683977.1 hypothetical protein [Ideonella sp.]
MHAITYEVIDLGTLDGGRTSGAFDLDRDRDGTAAGWSRVDGYQRASLFRDGAIVDVGPLGGELQLRGGHQWTRTCRRVG